MKVVLVRSKIPTHPTDMRENQRSDQPRKETPGVKGNKQFAEKYRHEAPTDLAASAESGVDTYVQAQIENAAVVLAARFPNLESISFRVEENWDNTIEGDDGEEWAALEAVVIDVIEHGGEEFDGDEHEDGKTVGFILDAELSQADLRDVYDNDASVPVFLG